MYFNQNSIIFYNGIFAHPKKISLDLYSQTLHYGNGVFEGIRSYDTRLGVKIFKGEAHYDRLKQGAEVMGIDFNYSSKELVEITYELLRQNGIKDAYIIPIITTGADMSLRTSTQSNLIIQCWEWGKYMGDKLLRVKTSKFQRPNPKSCYVEAKVTGHYINSVLSTNEAKREGYDEALLLDMNENVAECSGANVFFEKNGKLVTPPKGHIMPGITRVTIIELCKEEGINLEERYFKIQEIKSADSAFFTGTAAEVVGLKSIDNSNFPKEWETTLGYRLMHLYKAEVLNKRKRILVN